MDTKIVATAITYILIKGRIISERLFARAILKNSGNIEFHVSNREWYGHIFEKGFRPLWKKSGWFYLRRVRKAFKHANRHRILPLDHNNVVAVEMR